MRGATDGSSPAHSLHLQLLRQVLLLRCGCVEPVLQLLHLLPEGVQLQLQHSACAQRAATRHLSSLLRDTQTRANHEASFL